MCYMERRQRNCLFITMISAVADERRYKVLALELKCPIQVNWNHWIHGTVLRSSGVTGNCVVLHWSYCSVSAVGIMTGRSCEYTDSYLYPIWTIMTISTYPVFADLTWITTHTDNISKSCMKKSIYVFTHSCVTVNGPHCIITSGIGSVIDMLDVKPPGGGQWLAWGKR